MDISLLSGKEQKGLIEEYKKVEEKNKADQKPSEKAQENRLKSNLFRAMRNALLQRCYEDQELEKVKKYTKDSIAHERLEKTFIYYVKVDNYYAKFQFISDPRIFIQDPIRIFFEQIDENIETEHPDD
jgi:hypothetical protein